MQARWRTVPRGCRRASGNERARPGTRPPPTADPRPEARPRYASVRQGMMMVGSDVNASAPAAVAFRKRRCDMPFSPMSFVTRRFERKW
jgi:hypothetical protein